MGVMPETVPLEYAWPVDAISVELKPYFLIMILSCSYSRSPAGDWPEIKSKSTIKSKSMPGRGKPNSPATSEERENADL